MKIKAFQMVSPKIFGIHVSKGAVELRMWSYGIGIYSEMMLKIMRFGSEGGLVKTASYRTYATLFNGSDF